MIITAKYPSNIALIKYWGKYGQQLPMNPSISLTLSKAYTETSLLLQEKKSKEIEIDYYFEGKPNPAFQTRISKYIEQQPEFAELTANFALRIDSANSFPHSAGIASSASAFASVAAVLLKASQQNISEAELNRKGSYLARLGSGSAARSFYGPFVLWGKTEAFAPSSNDYAVPLPAVHENFQSLCDAILIVEDEPKKVSSSVGHALMQNHPYASARFQDANNNCEKMLSVLKNGDFESFISISEREALSLHSMMMTSQNYYLLMKPATIQIIDEILQFREETKLPICFTLDAGPNIHLLYPKSIEEKITNFVENELKNKIKTVLFDGAGKGGQIITN